nr:hypothetical protein [Tanacetum cinerariifolium]
MDIETAKLAISTALGALAIGTVKTSIVRGLKYSSNKGWSKANLDNSTSNVLIPLDSWTSGLLVYKDPLSRGEVVVWAVASGESGGGAVGRWQWCCMLVAAGCNDGSRGDNGVVSVEMMGLTVVAVVDMVAEAVGVSGVDSGVVMEMWRLVALHGVGGGW